MTTDAALWHDTYLPRPESIAQVRRDIRMRLNSAGFDDEVAETVILLASELATNALQHGHGPTPESFGVRLVPAATGLYLEVADNNQRMPQPRKARASDTGGRGLLLLARFGRKWGVTLDAGTGKQTWVLVAADLPEQLRIADRSARREESSAWNSAGI